MLVHALRQCTDEERERLSRVFSVTREQRTERDVDWVFRLFELHGSIDFARATLRRSRSGGAGRVRGRVPRRDPEQADRDFIRELIPYLGDRGTSDDAAVR